jgi:putative hydrolase of the HAD superfamily
MGRVRAVLFDALGTLLRLRPPAGALRDELAAGGVEVGEEVAAAAISAEIAYYREHCLEGRDRRALADLRRRCAAVLREALGPPAHGAGLDLIEAALLEALRFEPFPDVRPALRRLRVAGARLVVVSNWDVSLHDRLAETGLDALVDGAIASAELGVAKPAPAIFAHALTLAGVPAAEALHIGDSVVEDVEGARAAGIEPLLLVRDGNPPRDEDLLVVRSLREVPDLVA